MNSNLLIEASLSPDIKFELLQVQIVCKFNVDSFKILNHEKTVTEDTDIKYLWFYSDSVNDDLLDSLIISKNIVLKGTLSECKNTIIVRSEEQFYLVD